MYIYNYNIHSYSVQCTYTSSIALAIANDIALQNTVWFFCWIRRRRVLTFFHCEYLCLCAMHRTKRIDSSLCRSSSNSIRQIQMHSLKDLVYSDCVQISITWKGQERRQKTTNRKDKNTYLTVKIENGWKSTLIESFSGICNGIIWFFYVDRFAPAKHSLTVNGTNIFRVFLVISENNNSSRHKRIVVEKWRKKNRSQDGFMILSFCWVDCDWTSPLCLYSYSSDNCNNAFPVA